MSAVLVSGRMRSPELECPLGRELHSGWRMTGLSGPGGLVRVHRVAKGLTQEQLAEMSGLSVRAISDIERGLTARPRRSTAMLLESVLGITAPARPAADDHDIGPGVPRPLSQAVPALTGRVRELNMLS